MGPVLGPINGVLVEEFHTTYTTVANFVGYQFAAAGAAGLLCEVIARLWGKRPIYFLSIVFLFTGTVWNAVVSSGDVRGFMGARVLQVELLRLSVFFSVVLIRRNFRALVWVRSRLWQLAA